MPRSRRFQKTCILYYMYQYGHTLAPGSSYFSSPELKAHVSFSDRMCLSVCLSVCLSARQSVYKLFFFFFKTPWTISTKLAKCNLGVKWIQVCSNEENRPFPRVDFSGTAKEHKRNLKIFLSRTTGRISLKLGTIKASLSKVDSNFCKRRPCPFPRGGNNDIAKIHWRILKIFFSRTSKPNSTKLGTEHPWVNGFKYNQKKDTLFFKGR